jgi:superfamily II DNA or RNA helicase
MTSALCQLHEVACELDDVEETLDVLSTLSPGVKQYDDMYQEFVDMNKKNPHKKCKKEIEVLKTVNTKRQKQLKHELKALKRRVPKGMLKKYHQYMALQEAVDNEDADWRRSAEMELDENRSVKRFRGMVEELVPTGASGSLPTINDESDDEFDEVDVLDETALPLEKDIAHKLNYFSHDNDAKEVDIPIKVEQSGAIRCGAFQVRAELAKQMKSHQQDAVKMVLSRISNSQGTLLAHSMGLGKSLAAIAVMDAVMCKQKTAKILVLCPVSVLSSWSAEFDKWDEYTTLVWYRPILSNDFGDVNRWNRKGGVLIMGLERFRNYQQAQNDDKIEADYIVVDEAHRLKNEDNKLYKAVVGSEAIRILLTGSPLQNHIQEYFTMLELVEPNQFKQIGKSVSDVIVRGSVADASAEDISASKSKMRLFTMLSERCVHRRSSRLLQQSLPSLHQFKINYSVPKGAVDTSSRLFVEREQVMQLASPIKKQLVIDLIKQIRQQFGSDSILVFSRKPDALQDIKSVMDGYYMDGTTKALLRPSIVNDFSSADYATLLYMTTQVGGVGLNLQKANHVIICDPSWNPQDDSQAMSRAYRFGQTKPVYVYRLVAWNGVASDFKIEEYIYRLQVHKNALASRVVDEQEVDRHFTKLELRHAVDQSSYSPNFLDETHHPVTKMLLNLSGVLNVEDASFADGDEDEQFTDAEVNDAENQYNIVLLNHPRQLEVEEGLQQTILPDQTHFQDEYADKMVPPFAPCIKEIEGLHVTYLPLLPAFDKFEMKYVRDEDDYSVVVELKGTCANPDPNPATHMWKFTSISGNGTYRFSVRGVASTDEKSEWSAWSAKVVV